MAKPKSAVEIRTLRLREKYKLARRWHAGQIMRLDAVWIEPGRDLPDSARNAALDRLEVLFEKFFAMVPPDALNRED